MSFSPTALSTAGLRAERMTLLARYDSGAMSLAVYGVLKSVETDIAWREHRQHQPGVLRRSTRPSRPNATAQ
jgi:hypothetical protein